MSGFKKGDRVRVVLEGRVRDITEGCIWLGESGEDVCDWSAAEPAHTVSVEAIIFDAGAES